MAGGFHRSRPQIRDQWGVDGEIYLARKLSGGKSGAWVYAADLDSRDFGGQAILKLDRYPDPATQPNEAEQHRLAVQGAPEYAADHLPRLVNTYQRGQRVGDSVDHRRSRAGIRRTVVESLL